MVNFLFTTFRYGLLPVVIFCIIFIAASIDAYYTNAQRKSRWTQTVGIVQQSRDVGQVAADGRGSPSAFPDPHGSIRYTVEGKSYDWQGRGRDIGLDVLRPGDVVKIYYNPKNPQEISSLILLGKWTGNIILAASMSFIIFYAWFFWLRERPNRLRSSCVSMVR